MGGQLKGTFALGRDRHAFISHHLGDLDHFEAYRSFQSDVGLYEKLFAICPQVVAPRLASRLCFHTLCARRGQEQGLKMVEVQHHHAHMASCMAEHGLNERVIGVTFDGAGYGTDGAIWGGEFLVGDNKHYERAAHLRYVGLPGGDRAIREPWRIALSHLLDATGSADFLEARIPKPALRTIRQMIESGFNTVPTSSVGRLFDAVAVLVGIRDWVSFEGQAAIELEWSAAESCPDGSFSWEMTDASDGVPIIIDTRPIIRGVVEDVRAGKNRSGIARRFHSTMVEWVVAVCRRIQQDTGIGAVVLSGGVFMNVLLLTEALQQLGKLGFRVYAHRRVPCNDGGLSLGQLAIGAAQSIRIFG